MLMKQQWKWHWYIRKFDLVKICWPGSMKNSPFKRCRQLLYLTIHPHMLVTWQCLLTGQCGIQLTLHVLDCVCVWLFAQIWCWSWCSDTKCKAVGRNDSSPCIQSLFTGVWICLCMCTVTVCDFRPSMKQHWICLLVIWWAPILCYHATYFVCMHC